MRFSLTSRAWLILCLIFSGLTFFLAWNVHWSDSELWSLGLARLFPSDFQASMDYKPLFNALLRTVYWFGLDDHRTIDLARTQFAVLGLATAGLVFRIAKEWSGDLATARWTLFLFVTTTLFLSQGYKIRSDLMVCFFQAAGLLYWVKISKSGRSPLWPGLLLNLAMLLSAPKAVFHLAVNFVFALCLAGKSERSRKAMIWSFLPPLAIFLGLLIWKSAAFMTAFEYFLKSYDEFPQHPGFLSSESWLFVRDAFSDHWYLVVLALFGIFGARGRISSAWAAAAAASIAFIIIHSDRLPFFIFSLTLAPVIFVGLSSAEAFHGRFPLRGPLLAKVAVAIILLGDGFFLTGLMTDAGNGVQIEAQSRIAAYLDRHPGTVYFDGTSALPKRNTIFILPAPAHEGNHGEVLRVFERPDLDLVFFGNRMFFYIDDIFRALSGADFIRIGEGVFAKSSVRDARSPLGREDWLKICHDAGPSANISVYEGSDFLSMRPMNLQFSCEGDVPRVNSYAPFVAFSRYEPLEMPDGLPFARIFDHRPRY